MNAEDYSVRDTGASREVWAVPPTSDQNPNQRSRGGARRKLRARKKPRPPTPEEQPPPPGGEDDDDDGHTVDTLA